MSLAYDDNFSYYDLDENNPFEGQEYAKIAPFPGANGNNYFDEPQEKAVLYYIDPQTPRHAKDVILTKLLHNELRYLTEAVVLRYPKFVGLCGIDELVQMAFINLYEQLEKFKPHRLNKIGKVCKAYSYYGTIVRNFCKTHSEKTYKHESVHSAFDKVRDDLESNERYSYQLGSQQKEVGYESLKHLMTTRIREKIANSEKMRPNDMKIGHALITIFESWNYIYEDSVTSDEKTPTDFFLKKKIFQIIKDITGLTTKDISAALRSFGDIYGDLFREQQRDLMNDEGFGTEEDGGNDDNEFNDEFSYQSNDYNYY